MEGTHTGKTCTRTAHVARRSDREQRSEGPEEGRGGRAEVRRIVHSAIIEYITSPREILYVYFVVGQLLQNYPTTEADDPRHFCFGTIAGNDTSLRTTKCAVSNEEGARQLNATDIARQEAFVPLPKARDQAIILVKNGGETAKAFVFHF